MILHFCNLQNWTHSCRSGTYFFRSSIPKFSHKPSFCTTWQVSIFFLGKCAFKRYLLKNESLEQNRVNWPLLQDQLRQTLLELSLISGGSWTNSWLSLSIIIKWGSSAPPPPGSARGLERGVTINSRAGRLKSEQSASMHHSLYGHFSLNV